MLLNMNFTATLFQEFSEIFEVATFGCLHWLVLLEHIFQVRLFVIEDRS